MIKFDFDTDVVAHRDDPNGEPVKYDARADAQAWAERIAARQRQLQSQEPGPVKLVDARGPNPIVIIDDFYDVFATPEQRAKAEEWYGQFYFFYSGATHGQPAQKNYRLPRSDPQ